MTSGLMPTVSTEELLSYIEIETRRFVGVARQIPLVVHIPTYPDFTVETLSAHLGTGLRSFDNLARTGQFDPGKIGTTPTGSAVLDWVQIALAPVVKTLRGVDPHAVVQFPGDPKTVPVTSLAQWLAIEVLVHRWDLESVLGDHASIVPDLAFVGIEHVFDNYVPRMASTGVAPIGGTVELWATDLPVAWKAAVRSERLHVRRRNADSPKSDVTVRATAEDLFLVAWK